MTVRLAPSVALALIATTSFAPAATQRYGKPAKSTSSTSTSSTSTAPANTTPASTTAPATTAPVSTAPASTTTTTTPASTTPASTTTAPATTAPATTAPASTTPASTTTTTTPASTTMTSASGSSTSTTPASTTPASTTPAATSSASSTLTSACSNLSIGTEASFGGFVSFLSGDPWRTPVANLPVAANSDSIIGLIGGSKIHPDFGASDGDTTYGIPYTVVSGQTPVAINYQAYGGDSDPGPMPIPASAPVEGGNDSDGDRHVIVVNRDTCFAYELFNAHVQGDGTWNADSGAIWDLLNNHDRPFGWTSADAAGLPILPGLARYDEVAAGSINHALRFTLQKTAASAILPATHYSGSSSSSAAAPMGTRLRLKSSFDISGFSPANQVILQALKTYGMILADNGSNMYLSGTSDNRWSNDDLHNLGKVPASAFEVVNTGTPALTTAAALVSSVVGVVAQPTILGFSANSTTVRAGSPVTLSWSAPLASYFIVSGVGPVRGNSVTVTPTQTTTYTLYATNHFGQTTQTVTVKVQ